MKGPKLNSKQEEVIDEISNLFSRLLTENNMNMPLKELSRKSMDKISISNTNKILVEKSLFDLLSTIKYL